MRPAYHWALALWLALVLAGCNTQNAEPPPREIQASATTERFAESPSPLKLPPWHPPIGKAATIEGRISLAPGLDGNTSPEAVLFIIARPSGSKMPVAVVRLEGPTFPVGYIIGPQHMMIPSGRFEGEVEVSARLDGDGLVGPAQPGDLEGSYPNNPVSVGEGHVDFHLDKLY